MKFEFSRNSYLTVPTVLIWLAIRSLKWEAADFSFLDTPQYHYVPRGTLFL